MQQTKLVVKPDCLFGKRGKHDLVGLRLDFTEAQQFIEGRMNKVSGGAARCRAVLRLNACFVLSGGPRYTHMCSHSSSGCDGSGSAPRLVPASRGRSPPGRPPPPPHTPTQVVDMDGTVGRINCFIVEPFVPHEDEYYLCIQAGQGQQPDSWLVHCARLVAGAAIAPTAAPAAPPLLPPLLRHARRQPAPVPAPSRPPLPFRPPAPQVQSDRLGYSISFSEFGGMEIEENWDKVGRSGRGGAVGGRPVTRPCCPLLPSTVRRLAATPSARLSHHLHAHSPACVARPPTLSPCLPSTPPPPPAPAPGAHRAHRHRGGSRQRQAGAAAVHATPGDAQRHGEVHRRSVPGW